MVQRYFIHFAFKGTRYHGWQIQPNATSIQEVLTGRIGHILHEEVNLVGCGRTDAGVHARNFYAHFDLEENLDKPDLENLKYRMNRFLPPDISVFSVFPVPNESHARFSAISRTYKYYILREKDAFWMDLAWYYTVRLDINLMNEGAKLLLNHSDFASFSKTGSDIVGTNCTVSEAVWERQGEFLIFTIKANRFLRNMVRAIVGTLCELGREKIDLTRFSLILASGRRTMAGESVPANGLFLEAVEYPPGIIPVSGI